MTETQWERLHRIVQERTTRLDLTQAGVQQVGGPSPAYLRKLRRFTGPPSERMRASLLSLDGAMRWKAGTSWGLVDQDRADWAPEVLEDEEHDLVDDAPDEADHFSYVVAARLRAIPEGQERDEVMRLILAVLKMS